MRSLLAFALLGSPVLADYLGPKYPFPSDLSSNSSRVTAHWRKLSSQLDSLVRSNSSEIPGIADLTFSLGLFSPHDPLAATSPSVQYHHTAPEVATSRYGVNKVDGDSRYRAASITKLVTMFAGLINLNTTDWDRPLTDFFPQLAREGGSDSSAEHVQWDKITVMALASHNGGVPRDAFGTTQGDLSVQPKGAKAAEAVGLPPLTEEDPIWGSTCGLTEDLACFADINNYIKGIQQRPPTFEPWTSPGYANNGYILLGQILQNITGKDIERLYRDSIFDPLGMGMSSAIAPSEQLWSTYVVPEAAAKGMSDLGMEYTRSSGGVFSSLHDLAKLGTAILDHSLLSAEATHKWMKPQTHTDRLQVSVGAPWEIFRYTHNTTGVVTDMYCKSGDSGLFSTWLCLLPDFDMGFTILGSKSGSTRTLTVGLVGDLVVDSLMQGLMEQAALETQQKFAGVYESTTEGLNSSMTFAVNETDGAPPGLVITSFISNGTDVLAAIANEPSLLSVLTSTRLVPTITGDASKVAFRAVMPDDEPTVPLGKLSGLSSFGWATAGASTYGNVDTGLFIFDVDDGGCATAVSPVAYRVKLARKKQ